MAGGAAAMAEEEEKGGADQADNAMEVQWRAMQSSRVESVGMEAVGWLQRDWAERRS